MSIQQTAGGIAITIWTDGWPAQVELKVQANNGEVSEMRLSVRDLHDLRYSCDRVLAALDDKEG